MARKRAERLYASEDTQIQRWWVRTFSRPPNDPLFAAESLTYWRSWFLMDCMEEAEMLWQEVTSPIPPRAPPMLIEQRRRSMRRLTQLHRILERDPPNHDPTLEADLASSRAGEVPEFLRERMERQRETQAHV